ncbi:MAG: hypothetical protein M1436_09930, partial [Acidobacteria bacterium]|nr:hypothetical protein [Acidobacteriota bacterium]
MLHEVLSGRAVRSFPFEAFVGWAAFSADGRFFACASENDNHPGTTGLARVFDADTGRIVVELRTALPVEAGCFLETAQGAVFLCREAVADQAGPAPVRRNRVRGYRLPSAEPLPVLDLNGWEIRRMAGADSLALLGFDPAGTTLEVEGANLNFRQFKVGRYSYPDGGEHF